MKKTPKLRFPEFSGEWEEKTLDNECSFFSGGTPSTSKKSYYNGKIPFIRSGEIKSNKTELHINEEALKNSSAKLVYEGDLLYALYGATSGEVSISNINGAINQAILCIRSNKIDLNFLEKIFIKEKDNILNTYLQGGQGNLSANIIKGFKYRVPLINEQQKIAKFFSLIDKKIEDQQEKVEDLEEYKKGIIQKIFSQEIRFKDENGEEYPGWEKKKLGTVCTFLKGNRLSKEDISINGKPCILYGELYTRYREVIKKVYSKTNLEEQNLVYSKKNDVLIPSSGETAIDIATASCVQDDGIILGGDLNIMRSTDINGIFLSYQLNNAKRNDLAKVAQGASVVHIYNDQLKKIYVDVPKIEEQNKIASILETIDRKIEKEIEKLDQLKVWKKGLLQQMFV